ncbi:tol-pal system protein YbgF [Candidatus Pelagibacter sp.]|nr:tol-pal system protein YbgF [Candidatus Pelagibacter sp.]
MFKKFTWFLTYIISIFFITFNAVSEELSMREILEIIQKDLRTLERAVYSESFQKKSGGEASLTENETEDVLTRHLLKLSEIEKQFQNLTNKFEEINFKIDKLSSRLSKTQADNQLRFQDLENNFTLTQNNKNTEQNLSASENKDNAETDLASKKIMPGTSQPQDLGTLSYKDMTDTSETQVIQSVETTKTILTENFINEEKILPEASPLEQYEFATSFLKVGDYNMAERAFREFVDTNPDNDLSGNAQYWYAETFRIRQLYTDAASAYLEGYQKYPKSEKAPINLLKLGVSLVQIGEKDQGCLMIAGVKKQYPNATQSVLQKAKYEEKKFECNKENS